ncbi:phage tail tape measure protein [Mycetocola reblochoni]|uniref:phage tail tape measure protein n=1 Tax=Mycetocola reblochoni TaxID=331618 RepID=UPI003F9D048F
MAGKSAILAVRIIGDASKAVEELDKTSSKMDTLTKGAGVVGAASGAALAAGFNDAVNIEAAHDKLTGQLALTEEQSARSGTVAAELYSNGWGTGSEQINEALHGVMGNIDGMKDASDEALTSVTQGALTLANTFDQDLGATTTAVGQLMRTGMASDATEALDIITAGLQSNARAGDDLLDTFTEYPALFERLGIDGQTATGLIAQGLDAGARSTDLVADALKEFQIRATDGSVASAAGFETLGLSAEAMTAQIAAGGEGASKGLDTVLDRLRDMTDPVERNAAAVALFGTQAEDLGGALFALDPSTAVDSLGQVSGAAEKLGDTVNDNTAASLTTLWRTVQTSFSTIAAAALPVIQPILEGLQEFAPIIGPIAAILATLSGVVLVVSGAMKVFAAAQAIQTAAQWASNAAWLASPITWIVLAVIVALAALIAIIVLVVQNWDEIAAVAEEVWAAVCDAVAAAGEWIAARWDELVTALTGFFESIGTKASEVWTGIQNAVDGVVKWVQSIWDAAVRAIVGYFQWLGGIVAGIWEVMTAPAKALASWIGDKISNAISGVISWFRSLGQWVASVFDNIISWIRSALDWLGQMVSNVVPGWAKDLLGMSTMSARLDVSADTSAAQASLARMSAFAAPMMLTADAAVAEPAVMTATTALASRASLRDTIGAMASASTAVRDRPVEVKNVYEINVSGALDRRAVAREIRELLEDLDRRNGVSPTLGG